jgi:hypothetical protein
MLQVTDACSTGSATTGPDPVQQTIVKNVKVALSSKFLFS